MRCQREKAQNICRCFNAPKGPSFRKEGLYIWDFIIDGRCVFTEDDTPHYFGDLEFFLHFQNISKK